MQPKITNTIAKAVFLAVSLLFMVASSSTTCFAQADGQDQPEQSEKPKIVLPQKDGQIFIEKIYQVDSSLKKEVLFTRAKSWLMNLTSTDKEEQLIELQDKEQGKLMGKGYITYKQDGIFGGVDNRVPFKFDISLKDGKYRVQLYDFALNQYWLSSNSVTGRGHWTNDWPLQKIYDFYTAGKGRKKILAQKIEGFSAEIERLLGLLNKTMATAASKDDF